MIGRHSLTKALMLWISGIITLVWVLAVGLGALVMQEEFGEIFDSSLQETAERLVPLIIDELFQRDDLAEPRRIMASRAGSDEEYLTYQVRDQRGRVLLHSHAASANPFDTPLVAGFSDGPTGRTYTAAAVSNTIFVQVRDSAEHRREALLEGVLALLLPILLVVPVTIAAVWVVLRRILAPVDTLRSAIGRKDGGNLTAIDELDLPEELRPILNSVNLLLSRLRAVLAAEREFTSNSAHELRTPLAGALAQTQLLLLELKDGPAAGRARQIEKSLQGLTRLAEKLLQLARAEAGIGINEGTFDVADVIDMVIADFRGTAAGARLRLEKENEGTLVQLGSADAFAIALRNLIENALLYGRPDQPVLVRVSRDGTVRIQNGFPALAATELVTLRQRFARGDTSAAGSGLGLSIAERLLAQMQAELVLSSPIPGRDDGFQAEIIFAKPGVGHGADTCPGAAATT
nr:sensor histidine kinase [Rhizobium sp. TCK]